MNKFAYILFEHVSKTLPDSLTKRKELLLAVKMVLPRNHPARAHVMAQIASLEAVEIMQHELPLKFQSAESAKSADQPSGKKLFGKDGAK